MSIKRGFLTIGMAAAALLASSAAAFAVSAYATSSVNVRSGPGTGYHAVDTLHRGEAVDIDHCQGSWCLVSKSGPDGWVSANYLSRDGYGDDGYGDDYEDEYYADDDSYYIEDRPYYRRNYQPYYRPFNRPYYGGFGGYGGYGGARACVGGAFATFCVGN